MKTIRILAISLAILFSINCFAKDQIVGKIVDNLDQKVRIMNGDMAVINLGKNNGLIKGDILSIYKNEDVNSINILGKCALVNVNDSKSICEIIKIFDNEIGRDSVVIDKIIVSDANFYPVIFQLLTKVVEPYEPYKEIRVYINSILDEQNNVTKFSDKLQKEIKKVFSQKKRINVVDNVSPALIAYLPSEYAESSKDIEGYLKRDNLDAIIAGKYSVKEDKIFLNLYKVDKNYEDIVVDTTVNMALYSDSTTNIVTGFKPTKKEKMITSEIYYKPEHKKIMARDERNSIIETETRNDPFLEYNLSRIMFNIISPVEFKMIVDNNEINFEKNRIQAIPMTTGKHEITAKFKKGYYLNDSLLFTNETEIKKNIVVMLDNPDDIKIEVTANAVPGKENIDFKVYKKSDKSRPDFKPVLPQKNDVKIIETFKD